MKKLLIGLLVFGLAAQSMFSQDINLSEVSLSANYKYLDAINSEDLPVQVRLLEEKVAYYNLKGSDFYDDEYASYRVSFYIPEGIIVASYDEDGKILRTVERFKNVQLPRSVIESVAQNYPNWTVVQDWYKANYTDRWGIIFKQYKFKLKKENKTKTVTFNGNDEFL